tara:strand:+ start:1356 stop:3404 length:2049 start_codon:yes stop_codon:yes gene_type:complete
MALAKFISKIVTSITKSTFRFNNTLEDLTVKFEVSCPTTPELLNLVTQKNLINGALQDIQSKISTLNKVAKTSKVVVKGVKAGVSVIKKLPLPTSFPPGVGIPLSIINTFSDALDALGKMIDKEEGSLDSIPVALDLIKKDVSEIITKLSKLDVAITTCLEEAVASNNNTLTQLELDDILNDPNNLITENFIGVTTDAELGKLLSEPPGVLYYPQYIYNPLEDDDDNPNNNEGNINGVLYGGYYLRLNIIPSPIDENTGNPIALTRKQVTAQNMESVPPPGEFYNANASIEMLNGDKSYSSSNTVLVNEMKWLIDTKNLIFPPPPPAEDPLKAMFKESQIAIIMGIYGANREEALEIYELAWEFSQGQGPGASNYDNLVIRAFNNSRTLLEQAVADEAYEWVDGDRILDATIIRAFLADLPDDKVMSTLSLIKVGYKKLINDVNIIGGEYTSATRGWANGIEVENSLFGSYAMRLANTLPNSNQSSYNDENPEFGKLLQARKKRWQAVWDTANTLKLSGVDLTFNDPLADYFFDIGYGYNQPTINGIPITGTGVGDISAEEVEDFFDIQLHDNTEYFLINRQPDPITGIDTTPDGVTDTNLKAYTKTKLFLDLKNVLGVTWYNQNAESTSKLPFWSVSGNPNSPSSYYNDVNYDVHTNSFLNENDPWYFEFGRNGLPIPTNG